VNEEDDANEGHGGRGWRHGRDSEQSGLPFLGTSWEPRRRAWRAWEQQPSWRAQIENSNQQSPCMSKPLSGPHARALLPELGLCGKMYASMNHFWFVFHGLSPSHRILLSFFSQFIPRAFCFARVFSSLVCCFS
jgi:hypothetical protein